MGLGEKKELREKIMIYYIRWVYRLDFCTPRYLILRELGLEKIKWEIRARNFEEKIRIKREENIMRKCWEEKENMKKKDLYSRERKK